MQRHIQDIDFYLEIEDRFNCSGMCKPSLFYFTRDLAEGPPVDTCLVHMKQFLSSSSRSFATVSVLTGVTALFLFLFHFGLYCRPIESSEEGNAYANNEH